MKAFHPWKKITITDFLSGTFPLRNHFYHFLSDHDRSVDCYWLRLDVFIATGIILMMSFMLVYHFNNWPMINMLKHPTYMGLYLGFTCVLWKKCPCLSFSTLNRFTTHWIDSSKFLTFDESTHNSLNRVTFESSHSCLNRLTKLSDLHWIDWSEGWIISFFIPGLPESIHLCPELLHPSCTLGLSFCRLNRFTHWVNQFTMLFLCENCAL